MPHLVHPARKTSESSLILITTSDELPVNKRAFVVNCPLIALVFCVIGAGPALAQTFEIGGQSSPQPAKQAPAKKGKAAAYAAQAQAGTSDTSGIGPWGSGLEFSRLARKAEDELKRGNAASAADYTRRALQSAPENADLWFMLGYTSRLAGRLSDSLNAYEEGLKRKPNAPDGLAGLAQTYIKMGRNDDAKRLLLQAIASHPRSDDMLMAGELFM